MLFGNFDIPTFHYFDEGNIWTGSLFVTFNYRIMPCKAKADNEESKLKVKVWYGLSCYNNTAEFADDFEEDFSAQGLENVRARLEKALEDYKNIRKTL